MKKAKKKNILTIDLNEYCTQAEYARLTGIKLSTISQWVKRAKEAEEAKTPDKAKISFLDIPELSVTLVKKV